MIQRIQSIWLLLAAALFGIEYWEGIVFAHTLVPGTAPLEDSRLMTNESIWMTIGSLGSSLLAFSSIFLYGNRTLQVALSAVAGLVQIGFYLLCGFYILQKAGAFGQFRADYGIYAGLFGLTCNWLASRAIRKDVELVKSMERLR